MMEEKKKRPQLALAQTSPARRNQIERRARMHIAPQLGRSRARAAERGTNSSPSWRRLWYVRPICLGDSARAGFGLVSMTHARIVFEPIGLLVEAACRYFIRISSFCA